MATLKEIKITVNKDATLVVEPTKGFSGKECLAETKDLEEALGKLKSRDMKKDDGGGLEIGDKAVIRGN